MKPSRSNRITGRAYRMDSLQTTGTRQAMRQRLACADPRVRV
jgi:hypothetical protein